MSEKTERSQFSALVRDTSRSPLPPTTHLPRVALVPAVAPLLPPSLPSLPSILHLASPSNLAADDTRIAQSRQHNSRVPPRGRRIRPKHHLCSPSPVEPLFGTTASSDRVIAYGSFAFLRTSYCLVFLIRTSARFPRLPLLSREHPHSFIRPCACRHTLETIHSSTCKSGYRTSPRGSVAGKAESFYFPFSFCPAISHFLS